jgi:hypothetical protein
MVAGRVMARNIRSNNDAINYSVKAEAELAAKISEYYADPYGWVLFSYPWGEPTLPDGGFNPLAKKKGPMAWQKRLLQAMGRHIENNNWLTSNELQRLVGRFARSSGHGVGKSTIVAWVIQFLMSTRRDTRISVTANTAHQLETKTWPELAKWHKLLINKHWFEWTSTAYYFKLYPENERKNYMANAITVSEENTEAFAGLHNEHGTVALIFDEASGIFAKLWVVAEGALTDGEGFFFAFGNPTLPDGEFADCFDKNSFMYNTETIDSRTVEITNKNTIRDLIRKYGADSDEVRVRVYGQFPRQAFNGFITKDVIDEAIARELWYDKDAPVIMAVDVARYGKAATVIRVRQGRDARTRKPIALYGKNNVEVANVIMKEADALKPDAIVIEGTGPGGGVIDILKDRNYRVVEVTPGAPSSNPERFVRVRDELWSDMRDWLIETGCIPEEPKLIEQLGKMQYTLKRGETAYCIESKEDYTERTKLPSPDEADSLVLTFGARVARRDRNLDLRYGRSGAEQAITDYDIMAY